MLVAKMNMLRVRFRPWGEQFAGAKYQLRDEPMRSGVATELVEFVPAQPEQGGFSAAEESGADQERSAGRA
jgi:hypothetical protein